MHQTALISSFAVLTVAATATAQVVETASERYTRAAPDAGGQSVDTQNFGPVIYGDFDDFNSEVLIVGPSTGIGTAEQHSSIDPASYGADLYAEASCAPDFFDIVNGYGECRYDVAFTVMSTVDFNINGTATASGATSGETSTARIEIISVSGGSPTQTIVHSTDGIVPFDISGTLLAGDYELRAETLAVVSRSFDDSPGSALAGAVFTMTFDADPPALPGDMDCSGDVNVGDVAPFIQALLDPDGYDATHPACDKNRADMNQDSLRDGADISSFVAAVLGN